MSNIEIEILGLSSSQSQAGSFALVLGEKEGNRRLPIIIGMFEAQAIAIEIEDIRPNRPMTHDLFKSLASQFNISVDEIHITDLKEGVFFAKIKCSNGATNLEIDARPSDAIAIGLRFGATFYTNEKVLSEAGIILTNEEEEEELGLTPAPIASSDKTPAPQPPKKSLSLTSKSKEELEKLLDEAINNEQYERAAQIRDELDKR